jgi:hypothetical protein
MILMSVLSVRGTHFFLLFFIVFFVFVYGWPADKTAKSRKSPQEIKYERQS